MFRWERIFRSFCESIFKK